MFVELTAQNLGTYGDIPFLSEASGIETWRAVESNVEEELRAAL